MTDTTRKQAKVINKFQKEKARLEPTAHLRRIAFHWMVRAGLSNPSISLRSISDYLKDFDLEAEGSPMHFTTVSTARDVFGELLKRLNRQAIERFCSSGSGAPPRRDVNKRL